MYEGLSTFAEGPAPACDVHSLPSISTMHRRALARQVDHDVFQLSSLRVTLPTQGDSLSPQRNLAIDKRPCVGGYHLGCLLLAHDSGCSMTATCCLRPATVNGACLSMSSDISGALNGIRDVNHHISGAGREMVAIVLHC